MTSRKEQQEAWIYNTFNRRIPVSRIEKEKAADEAQDLPTFWVLFLVGMLSVALAVGAFPMGLVAAICNMLLTPIAVLGIPMFYKLAKALISPFLGQGIGRVVGVLVCIPLVLITIALAANSLVLILGGRVKQLMEGGTLSGIYLRFSFAIIIFAIFIFIVCYPICLIQGHKLRERVRALNWVDDVNVEYASFSKAALSQLVTARNRGGVYMCREVRRGGLAAHYAVHCFTGKSEGRDITMQIHQTRISPGDLFVIDDSQTVQAILTEDVVSFMEENREADLPEIQPVDTPKWYREIPEKIGPLVEKLKKSKFAESIRGVFKRNKKKDDGQEPIELGRI